MDFAPIISCIKELFQDDASGHDYFHTMRVYNNAMKIAEDEVCDKELVALAALLHDVDDEKLFSTVNYRNARKIMSDAGVNQALAEKVISIIKTVSFKGTGTIVPNCIEGKIVQDADRLDAIGAIGIARAFAYGGSRGRCMYNPDEKPACNMDAEAYRNSKGTSVNHFYEKLFLLKELMNTESAKRIAEERDAFMHTFIEEFYAEWEGIR